MLIGCVYSRECRVTAQGFQTFSGDCQFSGSLSGSYLLDTEDGGGFADLLTILADDAEDLSWILGAACLFDGALFELPVEKPFINLYPGKTSLRHGLLPHFTVEFAFVLLIQVCKDLDLLVRLALAVATVLAVCAGIVGAHFSKPSSGDF